MRCLVVLVGRQPVSACRVLNYQITAVGKIFETYVSDTCLRVIYLAPLGVENEASAIFTSEMHVSDM